MPVKSAIAPTIKDQVYAILKAEICGGEHVDGQRLQENDLATRLNVSRSPVREALRQLASDGLVLEIPNKGVFVRELTPKDIDDIFEMRLLLETYAINRSPDFMTPAALEKLTFYHGELARLHAAGELSLYRDIDSKLHSLLIQLSGNDVAIAVYDKISSLAQKFRGISLLGKQRFDDSVEEHQSIIAGLLKSDTAGAAATNKRHLQFAKQEIVNHLAAKNGHNNA